MADINTHRSRGSAYFERGLYCAAEEEWTLWLGRSETAHDALNEARALNALGVLSYSRHEFDGAISYYERAKDSLVIMPDDGTLAQIESNLGFSTWYIGDFERAKDAFLQSRDIFQKLDRQVLLARVELGLGLCHLQLYELQDALALTRHALGVFRDKKDAQYEGRALLNLGVIYTDSKQYGLALESLERALEVNSASEDKKLLAYTYTEMARLFFQQGDLTSAFQYSNHSLSVVFSDLTQVDRMELARLSQLFGRIYMSLKDYDKAIGYLERAEDYYSILGASYDGDLTKGYLEEAHSGARVQTNDISPVADGSGFREQELRLQYLNTFLCLADALEAKDPYTRGHSERVTTYSLVIAREMKLAHREMEILGTAGRLHDVGKMMVSDAILNKPGKLTREEYEIIQRHPKAGVDMTKFVLTSREALSLVRHHHERFDGTGYPDGLTGKEIPILTRILSVADVYDALTSTRPYRSAFPHSKAMEILSEQSGTQFDPGIVQVFCECHRLPT